MPGDCPCLLRTSKGWGTRGRKASGDAGTRLCLRGSVLTQHRGGERGLSHTEVGSPHPIPSHGLAVFWAGLLLKQIPVWEERSEGVGPSFASHPILQKYSTCLLVAASAHSGPLLVPFPLCPLLCGYSCRTLEEDPLRRGWLRPLGSPGPAYFGCVFLRPCSL